MSRNPQTAALLIILLVIAIIAQSETSYAYGTIMYWGHTTSDEFPSDYAETLKEACDAGTFNTINLAYLNYFGGGRTPSMNLTGICDLSSGECAVLGDEIRCCQKKGIKVLLSLGGPNGDYYLTSEEDAQLLADYLWDTFLSEPTNTSQLLGGAVFDGIDFDIQGGSNQHWDNLVRFLKLKDSDIFLSAAPQCTFTDNYLEDAIETGHFNAAWVKFYNNPSCQYSLGNPFDLIESWEQWYKVGIRTSMDIYLGLPASAVGYGGFIPAAILNSVVIPAVARASNYGGVMLWSRYWDRDLPNYANSIKYPSMIGDGLAYSSA